jgi:predicted small lipoprotein YifL
MNLAAGLRVTGLGGLRCLILVLAVACIATLAACGKKGPPLPPPDQPKVYPRTYPYDPTAKPRDSDESPQ